MQFLWCLMLVFGLAFGQNMDHQLAKDPSLKVGVLGSAPFVMHKDNKFNGLSVAYWKNVADRLGMPYTLISTNASFDQSVKEAADGKYDVLVGPISVTSDRAKLVDFSRPYFVNNVGLVLKTQSLGFWDVMLSMFGDAAIQLLIGFMILLVIFTHLFYFSERRYAKRYKGGYAKGMADASWTTISSFLRDVLYDPVSGLGRFILAVWLVISVVFMAAFTAVVTSTMTYTMSQGHIEIKDKYDLEGRKVAVQAGTSMVGYALNFGAIPVEYGDHIEGLKMLGSDQVVAVLGNFYALKHDLDRHDSEHQFRMSDLNLRNDEFAFVTPKGSKVMRKIDAAILYLQDEQKSVDRVCTEYLGPKYTHSCEF